MDPKEQTKQDIYCEVETMGGRGKSFSGNAIRIGGADVRVYNSIPPGWRIRESALTAPKGYKWIYNGKGRFSNDYQTGLYKTR